jgi:hypothetical protein
VATCKFSVEKGQWIPPCVCEFVCVCVRERARERESARALARERKLEREREWIPPCVCKRERASVCVVVCVYEYM